ncbi:VIT1/CCC1 transporter family protein [Agromyces endophyticus]|uniref:VIT1/CCC1 transporter family protein n=1 Tax=Agromyces sp. H17E-10 TaxID=2932244 RepID=UPI001FD04F61|nr:VIT1/CCC1 transporter family protein [Agromyces sp. H17E-10]UOQ87813.1 VIT1/CCC1 transporter family protein [Agromyces sp. H17E-10]
MAANDGIIGTAGVLQGFAGAGASSTTLLVASVSAMVAGAVAGFGSKYAELAAERDAQQALIADEASDLASDDADELADLAEHFEERGVPGPLAEEVASEMHRHEPLAAHLETEHGITEPMRALQPLAGGAMNALALASGSALPLLILLAYPAAWESWAVFVAVLVSLAVTSMLVAVSARTSVPRALTRTIGIGAATMLLSYLAGVLIF